MHLEFSGDVSRETSAASGRLFHGLGDEIPNHLREENDQDDDGDGSGDRTAVLLKAVGAQVVAHDVEGASHQAENQQHLAMQEEHHQRRDVGRKVDGFRDAGG